MDLTLTWYLYAYAEGECTVHLKEIRYSGQRGFPQLHSSLLVTVRECPNQYRTDGKTAMLLIACPVHSESGKKWWRCDAMMTSVAPLTHYNSSVVNKWISPQSDDLIQCDYCGSLFNGGLTDDTEVFGTRLDRETEWAMRIKDKGLCCSRWETGCLVLSTGLSL